MFERLFLVFLSRFTSLETHLILYLVDHQIKEKHFGKYEDMSINDFIIMAKAANTNPYEYTPETAETDESVEIRTKAFLLDAIKKVTIQYISIFKFAKSSTL